jgi:hypothetical protein
VKRSELGPGKKALERGSTFASRGEGLQRSAPKPRARSISPASPEQRAKVAAQVCAVCCFDRCDPAHLAPRSHGGCDHADCVIALCRPHHRAFDDGTLDLTPYLAGRGFNAELAHMQGHYDDPVSVLHRLSGMRWAPERSAA